MTYGLPDETIQGIRRVLMCHPEVDRAIIYGSRAKGSYRPGSDIDLALAGETVTLPTMLKIELELDDLLLPYKIDMALLAQIEDPAVLAHIARVGQVLYDRAESKLEHEGT